ncbi:MAG: hypothetical protein IIC26_05650 [Chloroflexi bacterium]|nr:hypothetical protein [Chloroflexota bacterium]
MTGSQSVCQSKTPSAGSPVGLHGAAKERSPLSAGGVGRAMSASGWQGLVVQ